MILDKSSFELIPNGLDAPLPDHLVWVNKHFYSKDYLQKSAAKEGIARPLHGAQHAARVAVYIPILANLYRKYGDKDALGLNPRRLKLLQIAALFHDCGREAEGEDHWDRDSATNLFYYLSISLQVEHYEAIRIAEAMANKDYKPGEIYHYLISNKTLTTWIGSRESVNNRIEKSFFSKLIGSADCLDIKRARIVFNAEYLDFYKDYVYKQAEPRALDDLATLITEVKSLIYTQGDNERDPNYRIKANYENHPEQLFQLIAKDITTGYIEGTCQLLRPAMAILYQNGALLSEEVLRRIVISPKPNPTEDRLVAAMHNGCLYARGIRTPAALLSKPAEKLAKITEQDIRYKETLAQCELRKILRPQTQHANDSLPTKVGNRNRSSVLLGWGGSTYAPAGLLLFNEDVSTIKTVSMTNCGSGFGKRNNLTFDEASSARLAYYKLIRKMKEGGSRRVIHGFVATHNEVIFDIHPKMVSAVYYNKGVNFINARVSNDTGFPVHDNAPILEAIFIQKAYLAQTGVLLDIYEYSDEHHFLQKREFSEDTILQLWSELIAFTLNSGICLAMIDENRHFIDQVKLCGMYKSVNGYWNDVHRPLDHNYEPPLKQRLLATIKSLMTQYSLFCYVNENRLKDVRSILDQLASHPKAVADEYLNRQLRSGETVMAFIKSMEVYQLLSQSVRSTPSDKTTLEARFYAYAVQGNATKIALLLDMGVTINVTNKKGNSALILAAGEGRQDVVKLLLSRGADPALQGEEGLTALSWAARRGQEAMVTLLLETPDIAAVLELNKNGESALVHASSWEIFDRLSAKIKPGAVDKNHLNDLMFEAAKKNNLENMIRIVKAGANPEATNQHGQTAYALCGYPSMNALLQSQGGSNKFFKQAPKAESPASKDSSNLNNPYLGS